MVRKMFINYHKAKDHQVGLPCWILILKTANLLMG